MSVDAATHALLVAYVLGELEGAPRLRLEGRLETEPDLERALAEISENIEVLIDSLPPVPNPGGGRAQLLTAFQDPLGRRAGLIAPLREMFQLDEAGARRVLDQVDAHPTWPPASVPGLKAWHFEAPVGSATVTAGLVLIPKGCRVPLHRHLGREGMLVVSGRLHVSTGELLLPGDRLVIDTPGNPHSIWAGPHEDVVYALLHGGIEIIDQG